MDTDQLAELFRDYGVYALAVTVCGALTGYWVRRARDYKTFVAWRYLLVNPRRVSNRVLAVWFAGIGVQLAFFFAIMLDAYDPHEDDLLLWLQLATALVTYVTWIGWVLRHSMLALSFYVFFMVCSGLAIAGMVFTRKDLIPFVHVELEQQALVQNGF